MSAPLVLHDFFLAPDGGGRVALALAEAFGAELWAGEVNPAGFPADHPAPRRARSLSALAAAPWWLRWSKSLSLARAFARFPARKAPWTVCSGSLAPLAAARIAGPKVHYCHTPPRLAFDLKEYHLRQEPLLRRPALALVASRLRREYARALACMDVVAVNSTNVRDRLERHLGVRAQVIHPPCDTSGFAWQSQEPFFLSAARLSPVKRVDVVVEAFRTRPKLRLVVASGGEELGRIRAMAAGAPNIEVLGWVDEKRLRDLMGRCTATVYVPMDEDFGMTPVESMAAGKPVIGVAEGGLLETVIHGETGLLLPRSFSPEQIAAAAEELSAERALGMRGACERRAERFGVNNFIKSFTNLLSSLAHEN